MEAKNLAVLACVAGSVLLGACSSESESSGNNLEALQAVAGSNVSTSTPGGTSNAGFSASTAPAQVTPAAPVVPVVDPNRRISAQLADGVLDNIVLGDGNVPITDGDWPRFTTDTSWTWQLLGDTDTSYEVDVYVLDMFQQLEGDVIERLHAQGKKAICYFSAGTYEPWRPDIALFKDAPLGNFHYSYLEEVWLDVTSPVVAKIMANRMDMAVALGCDGVELDNVDGFVADTGFERTYEQELAYQRLLANEAHKRGLSVALKNAVEMIPDVADYFDLAINEVCLVWNECGTYDAIVAAGKPVFHVEYDKAYVNDPAAFEAMCAQSAEVNMRTLVLPKILDGSFRKSCDDLSPPTP